MVYARYEVVLHGPIDAPVQHQVEAIRELPGFIREAEENLTIMMPQDFHVTINPVRGVALGSTAFRGGSE